MQELAKQFTHIMSNISEITIISFLPRPSGSKNDEPSFKPFSIQRNRDGEIFTIGDTFTNGKYKDTKVIGTITGFSMLDDHVFIEHTWSGVGFGLDSIDKVVQLPSEHQYDDEVILKLGTSVLIAKILAVHFYNRKEKYDIEVIACDDSPAKFRLYNVEQGLLVKKPKLDIVSSGAYHITTGGTTTSGFQCQSRIKVVAPDQIKP
jgi:hypothetical protein